MSGNSLQEIRIGDLRFDIENMRLAVTKDAEEDEEIIDDNWCQTQLEYEHKSLEIAQSILDNGYRNAECLLVTPIKNSKGKVAYTVVEGNRRLSALRGLANKEVRDRDGGLRKREWAKMADENLEKIALYNENYKISCMVYADKTEAYADAARMHLTRKLNWGAQEQARYVYEQHVKNGKTLTNIKKELGRRGKSTQELFTSYAISEQAKTKGFPKKNIKHFSLITVAIRQENIRKFIGLEEDSDTDSPEVYPIPKEKMDALRELFGFIYGDVINGEVKESVFDGDTNRLIATKLCTILGDKNPDVLKTLRETRNIDEAYKLIPEDQDSSKDLVGSLNQFYALIASVNNPNQHKTNDLVVQVIEKIKEKLAEFVSSEDTLDDSDSF